MLCSRVEWWGSVCLARWLTHRIGTAILLSIAVFVSCAQANDQPVAPRAQAVFLPAYVPLTVTEVLLQHAPPQSIMGDGVSCQIFEVAAGEIDSFIAVNAVADPQWRPGALALRTKHMRVFEWLEKWMKAANIYNEVDAILNLKSVKMAKRLNYRLEYRMDSHGRISNAKIWILFPDRRITCTIIVNT
jgi:hypothetical protein